MPEMPCILQQLLLKGTHACIKNKVDFTTISQWTMNTHDDIIAIAAEDAGGGVCNFVFSLW